MTTTSPFHCYGKLTVGIGYSQGPAAGLGRQADGGADNRFAGIPVGYGAMQRLRKGSDRQQKKTKGGRGRISVTRRNDYSL
jgi:hypothetical protein